LAKFVIGEFSSVGSINSMYTLFVFKKQMLTFCEPIMVGKLIDSKLKKLAISPSDSLMF